MTFNEFKDYCSGKAPAEKLRILLEQVDIYGDDKKCYAEALYGRRNNREADYWRREALAMRARIRWLYEEILPHLETGEIASTTHNERG